MESLLISQDISKINQLKKKREQHQNYFQEFLIELNKIDIEVTVQELILLSTFGRNTTLHLQQSKIYSFVQDCLVKRAGVPDFNGVKINADALRELIAMPDLSNIYALLERFQSIGLDIRVNASWFDIKDGLISLSENSDRLIEDANTFYTKNEAGNKFVKSLLSVCDAINQHNQEYKFLNSSNVFNQGLPFPIDGIELQDSKFVPSVLRVRQVEDNYNDPLLTNFD